MTYITVRQSPMYRQMSLEEFLFQDFSRPAVINANMANTRTYCVESVSQRFLDRADLAGLVRALEQFNGTTAALRERDRRSLYHTFYIPKKKGGLRRIDAPIPELMDALRHLKTIFETEFHALYHTAAFAYVENRCTIDAVKRHQENHSRWFAKLDLHNFFGSTTLEFVMSMVSQIFPFSELVKYPAAGRALREALDLAFLDGVLPQGTPLSPLITNVMMIPIDFKLYNSLRDFEKQSYVYTRYADDFIISSKYDFDVRKIEGLVLDTLAEFHAPFSLNRGKTRYGSSAGSNWNLGVMLNKDNEITVGHKNKKRLQTMLFNYAMDRKNGTSGSRENIQTMQGNYSYYRMVEHDPIDRIVSHIDQKTGGDVLQAMKDDLK